ncbi:hypothetical protein Acel_1456 [Acidothermus cellulolyticus 11B]|uniref:Lipoprotein n=1 Tax=Acidothermus cellulolyticus (strain ATCC 43068 / DSM 8971 / 11B) TaxID=351607 RepID=A0LUW8_ACIC1|nr:hypothetical protein Acel_1456 [Acidothermus cellulolyticus 11B]
MSRSRHLPSSLRAVAAVLILFAAGCSSTAVHPAESAASSARPTDLPSVEADAAPSAGPGAASAVTDASVPPTFAASKREFPVAYEYVGHLSFDGSLAVFAGASQVTAPANLVVVLDLRSGTTRVIGRATVPGGVIAGIAVGGRYVAWTEAAQPGDTAQPTAPWRLHLTDLTTGTTRTLAASGSPRDVVVPAPTIARTTVLWQRMHDPAASADAQPQSDVVRYDITTGTTDVIATVPAADTWRVSDGCVVAVHPAGGSQTTLSVAPLASPTHGQMRVLDVGDPYVTVANGWVVWHERSGSAQATAPWSALRVTPNCTVDGDARRVADSARNVVPGADVAAIVDADGQLSVVRWADSPGTGTVVARRVLGRLDPSEAYEVAVQDDQICYVSGHENYAVIVAAAG